MLVCGRKKMSGRKSLDNLASDVNVKGEEAVGRRVGAERTHMQRLAERMAARREETWRPMSRNRASAFIRLYLAALVDLQNAFRYPDEEKAAAKMLNESLVKRLIPFVYRKRVWTLDGSLWPITLGEFQELNEHLATKLPKVHAGHQWQTIVHYYRKIKREREEWQRLEELERNAKEA